MAIEGFDDHPELHVAGHDSEAVLKRRCRNHKITAFITERALRLGPTSALSADQRAKPVRRREPTWVTRLSGLLQIVYQRAVYRCLSGVPQWLRITGDRVSRDGCRIGAVASIRDRKRKRDRSESGGQIPTGDRVWIDGRTMQPEPPPRRPIHGNLRVSTSRGLASNLFWGRKTESTR